MDIRFPFEVAASIAMSLALAAIPTVPFVINLSRTFSPEYIPVAESGEEGLPEEADDDWSPLPASPPRVAVVSRAPQVADPPPVAVTTEPMAEKPLLPVIVSALPPVEGGTVVAIADPSVLLERGWGSEPPEGEEPEDDGAPEVAQGEEIDNDGLADASDRALKRSRHLTRPKVAKARVPKAPPAPCVDDNPAIAEAGPGAWAVNRSLVEYYATHLVEFESIATYVVTHKDAQGTPDGFKVGLRRCGVLWEGGFRSGDVVSSVNGRTITTVMQAVGAYFALRNEKVFDVAVTRKGGEALTLRYTLFDDSREDREKMREFLKEARVAFKEVRREEREAKRAKRAEERKN